MGLVAPSDVAILRNVGWSRYDDRIDPKLNAEQSPQNSRKGRWNATFRYPLGGFIWYTESEGGRPKSKHRGCTRRSVPQVLTASFEKIYTYSKRLVGSCKPLPSGAALDPPRHPVVSDRSVPPSRSWRLHAGAGLVPRHRPCMTLIRDNSGGRGWGQ